MNEVIDLLKRKMRAKFRFVLYMSYSNKRLNTRGKSFSPLRKSTYQNIDEVSKLDTCMRFDDIFDEVFIKRVIKKGITTNCN